MRQAEGVDGTIDSCAAAFLTPRGVWGFRGAKNFLIFGGGLSKGFDQTPGILHLFVTFVCCGGGKMTRKPVEKKSRAPWHVRLGGAATRHPAASALTVAAGIVAIVITISEMRPAIEWASDHIQTPQQTKRDLDDLRREVQRADDALKREADAHGKSDDRRGAWLTYGMADLKSTILRNRVRDCMERKRAFAGGAVLALNCEDYEREYKEAYDRAEALYKAAVEASK